MIVSSVSSNSRKKVKDRATQSSEIGRIPTLFGLCPSNDFTLSCPSLLRPFAGTYGLRLFGKGIDRVTVHGVLEVLQRPIPTYGCICMGSCTQGYTFGVWLSGYTRVNIF